MARLFNIHISLTINIKNMSHYLRNSKAKKGKKVLWKRKVKQRQEEQKKLRQK